MPRPKGKEWDYVIETKAVEVGQKGDPELESESEDSEGQPEGSNSSSSSEA